MPKARPGLFSYMNHCEPINFFPPSRRFGLGFSLFAQKAFLLIHLKKGPRHLIQFYKPEAEVLGLWGQLLVFAQGAQAQPELPSTGTQTLDIWTCGAWGSKAASECQFQGNNDDNDPIFQMKS